MPIAAARSRVTAARGGIKRRGIWLHPQGRLGGRPRGAGAGRRREIARGPTRAATAVATVGVATPGVGLVAATATGMTAARAPILSRKEVPLCSPLHGAVRLGEFGAVRPCPPARLAKMACVTAHSTRTVLAWNLLQHHLERQSNCEVDLDFVRLTTATVMLVPHRLRLSRSTLLRLRSLLFSQVVPGVAAAAELVLRITHDMSSTATSLFGAALAERSQALWTSRSSRGLGTRPRWSLPWPVRLLHMAKAGGLAEAAQWMQENA